MKKYNQNDVDKWVKQEGEANAEALFQEMLPEHTAKLNRLDKRIQNVLAEINKVFPDAQYYTASGGFNLILGDPHDDSVDGIKQPHRSAWNGNSVISDGDW